MKKYSILIFIFFINYAECSYIFTGSSTNCNDDEVEEYIKPGQQMDDIIWKENDEMTVSLRNYRSETSI